MQYRFLFLERVCYTVNPRSKEWKKGIVWNKTKFTLRCREFCCVVREKRTRPALAAHEGAVPRVGFGDHAPANACGSRHRVLRALYGSVPHGTGTCRSRRSPRVKALGRTRLLLPRTKFAENGKAPHRNAKRAFPDTAEALEKLPGIGAYTAGAVASICFEQPAAAVDGNVLRIIMRMTADGRPIDLPQVKKEIGEALCKVYPKALRCVHAGAHGAWRVCLYAEKPQVRSLPHAELLPCIYSRKRHKIPRKTSESRKENRRAYRAFARMQRQIRRGKAKQDGFARRVMAVSERTSKARCPNRRANSAELSHRPKELMLETHKTHIFTHIRWEMTGYVIRCNAMSEAFTWASLAEIEHDFALPTAFRQFRRAENTMNKQQTARSRKTQAAGCAFMRF